MMEAKYGAGPQEVQRLHSRSARRPSVSGSHSVGPPGFYPLLSIRPI